jgi:hypothetical protein
LEQSLNIVQFIRFLKKIPEKIIGFGVISTFVRNVQKIVWELPEIGGDGGSKVDTAFIYLLNIKIQVFIKIHQMVWKLIDQQHEHVHRKFNIVLRFPRCT